MKNKREKSIDVTLLQEGILHIHLKDHADINLNDAVATVVEMGKLSHGKKMPVFIDAGEFCTVDNEVRIFSASEESNIYTLADAIAYNNLGQKLIANFYLNQNHPRVPTKVFSEKEEAIKWLKTFIKKL
jgi:hypothetical protein